MQPIGLGCMRLSTEARDDDGAVAMLVAAIEAGVELLDTADCYAHDDTDLGHNEQLIARAMAASRRVTVVTKGGLVRPDGAWLPDGRASHLAAAARASRERLGAIDLYLLHAIDPRVPLATSVRALARLREAGIVGAIGLSNVNATQLEAALAIAPIEAVEVELSPWRREALDGGLVAACERRGIQVLAHRPFGGPAGLERLARDATVAELAAHHRATPAELVLAWLRRLSPMIVPLPGATRLETAVSAARRLELDDAAVAALTARFCGATAAFGGGVPATAIGGGRRDGEVVVIAGMPGAGKSTHAQALVARGYLRLNRDERGGSLAELARVLDRELAEHPRVVLDNTYPSRASRTPVIRAARKHGLAVRCLVMTTSLEDAQVNAAARMLAEHGRLLEPAEIARDPRALPPSAQFRFRRQWEPPRLDEGFAAIEELPFEREITGGGEALIVELDHVVWRGRPRTPVAIELLPGIREALLAWPVIAGTTWQPDGPIGALGDMRERLETLLGRTIPIAACHHPAGPPVCWCRKPLPGLGLVLARELDLELTRCTHLGQGPADRGFAMRLGMRYLERLD